MKVQVLVFDAKGNSHLEDREVDSIVDLKSIRASKETDISDACNAAIVAGMDVETSQGTEHFALQETDQINLTTALSAVQAGAAGYPYHADGQLCRMFMAEEIQAIAQASVRHQALSHDPVQPSADLGAPGGDGGGAGDHHLRGGGPARMTLRPI